MAISRGQIIKNKPGQAFVEGMKYGSDVIGSALKLRQQWEQLRLYEKELEGVERKRRFDASFSITSALAKQNPLGWAGVARENPKTLEKLFSAYGGSDPFEIQRTVENIANSNVDSEMFLNYIYQQYMLEGLPMNEALKKANEESNRMFEIDEHTEEGGVGETETGTETVYEYHPPNIEGGATSSPRKVPFGWEENADVGESPIPGEKGAPIPAKEEEKSVPSWTEAFAGTVEEKEVPVTGPEEKKMDLKAFTISEEQLKEKIKTYSKGDPNWGGSDFSSKAASAMIIENYPPESPIWKDGKQSIFNAKGEIIAPKAHEIWSHYKATFELQEGDPQPKAVEIPDQTLVSDPYSPGGVPKKVADWWVYASNRKDSDARAKAVQKAEEMTWKYDLHRIPGGLEGAMRRSMGMEDPVYTAGEVETAFVHATNGGIIKSLIAKKELTDAEIRLLNTKIQYNALVTQAGNDPESPQSLDDMMNVALVRYANDPVKLAQFMKNMVEYQNLIEINSNPFHEDNPGYQTYKQAMDFLSGREEGGKNFWQERKIRKDRPIDETWLKSNGYYQPLMVVVNHIGSAIPGFKSFWDKATWEERINWFGESPPTSMASVADFIQTTSITTEETTKAMDYANQFVPK